MPIDKCLKFLHMKDPHSNYLKRVRAQTSSQSRLSVSFILEIYDFDLFIIIFCRFGEVYGEIFKILNLVPVGFSVDIFL